MSTTTTERVSGTSNQDSVAFDGFLIHFRISIVERRLSFFNQISSYVTRIIPKSERLTHHLEPQNHIFVEFLVLGSYEAHIGHLFQHIPCIIIGNIFQIDTNIRNEKLSFLFRAYEDNIHDVPGNFFQTKQQIRKM
jgi:hypothetical protein